jgi:hypothetical protein
MDRARTTQGAHPAPGEPQPVLLARGVFQEDLQRIAELLEANGIDFDVEETPHGGMAHEPEWRVLVAPPDAARARRAVAALARSAMPDRPSAPAPRPLFESHGTELLRVALMALCFGLAAWLLLRS